MIMTKNGRLFLCNSMHITLDLRYFVRLKHIVIGNKCFREAFGLIVRGLPALESFTCGNQSLIRCSRVEFESDPCLFNVMNRLASFDLL